MTAPVPPDCQVFIDGVQLPDGCLDAPETDPTALSGLRVSWGRNTAQDQPPPATCSFDVLDLLGGQRFLDALTLGARLDVKATALVYPDPDSTGNIIASGTSRIYRNTTVTPWVLNAVKPGTQAQLVVPPGVLQPVNSNRTAWDGIPRTAAGQTWRFALDVTLPAPFAGWSGWTVVVSPVAFTAPWDAVGSWTVLAATATAGVPDGTGTATFAGEVLPPPGVWLGVSAVLYPTGPQWDQLDTATASSWDSIGAAVSWDGLTTVPVSNAQLNPPADPSALSCLVFSGRITDLEARYLDSAGGSVIAVTAQDHLSELLNRDVGSTPWLLESMSARFNRIVTASGQAIAVSIDTDVSSVPVSWRDVDRQPAGGLLQELADSVDGVLWTATHLVTGPYLWVQSMNNRVPMMILAKGTDGLVHIELRPDVDTLGVTLSSCLLELEPVRWRQDTQDVATRVDVNWRDQTLDDKGNPAPTGLTETVLDSALEARIGVRRMAVSTQLSTAVAAANTGASMLQRAAQPGWRVSGLEWRASETPLDSTSLGLLMKVLDGTSRLGLPLVLTDLPTWTQVSGTPEVPLFLEGGTYTNTDGAWTLELITSGALGQGQSRIPWDGLPAADWSWDQFAGDISWDDLRGVGL